MDLSNIQQTVEPLFKELLEKYDIETIFGLKFERLEVKQHFLKRKGETEWEFFYRRVGEPQIIIQTEQVSVCRSYKDFIVSTSMMVRMIWRGTNVIPGLPFLHTNIDGERYGHSMWAVCDTECNHPHCQSVAKEIFHITSASP